MTETADGDKRGKDKRDGDKSVSATQGDDSVSAAPAREQNAIELESVSKSFKVYLRPRHWLQEKLLGGRHHREIVALDEVSFQVRAGQCLGVIGVNGAGKSTLLRLLAGISPPSRGRVSVAGRVASILELDSGFHPEFTGRENLRIGASVLGLSPEEIKDREREIIEFSGLGEFIDLPVRAYSSGMYLRLGFSLATAVEPEVLLVDEALAVGDEWFRGKCVDRILQIRERGATIVIVSHDLTLVRALCDRAALLERGRIVADGKPAEVINAYLERIYEQAVKEAGASPSPRAHRGAGELEINNVRLLGPDDRPTTLLRTGEPFAVEFDYRAAGEISSPLFGINIFRADGVLAVCTNSESAAYTASKFGGREGESDSPALIAAGHEGSARFAVEKNTLLAGDYELSVNVFRGRSGAHVPVDELLGAVKFKVMSGDHADRGLVLFPGRWKIR